MKEMNVESKAQHGRRVEEASKTGEIYQED
jgi:hypothetical protein